MWRGNRRNVNVEGDGISLHHPNRLLGYPSAGIGGVWVYVYLCDTDAQTHVNTLAVIQFHVTSTAQAHNTNLRPN